MNYMLPNEEVDRMFRKIAVWLFSALALTLAVGALCFVSFVDGRNLGRTIEMRTLNREEARLLVYLESRAVDYAGVVDTSRMDDDEKVLAEKWNDEGFIFYGALSRHGGKRGFNHWVVLSDEAWAVSAADRKAIAVRNHRADPNIPEAALKAISDAR